MYENKNVCSKEYYLKSLINKFFKLLPIYEGVENVNGGSVLDPYKACNNYKNNVVILETELIGAQDMFGDDRLLELVIMLKGMKNIGVGQHEDVKKCVFKLIKISKRICEKNDV